MNHTAGVEVAETLNDVRQLIVEISGGSTRWGWNSRAELDQHWGCSWCNLECPHQASNPK